MYLLGVFVNKGNVLVFTIDQALVGLEIQTVQ